MQPNNSYPNAGTGSGTGGGSGSGSGGSGQHYQPQQYQTSQPQQMQQPQQLQSRALPPPSQLQSQPQMQHFQPQPFMPPPQFIPQPHHFQPQHYHPPQQQQQQYQHSHTASYPPPYGYQPPQSLSHSHHRAGSHTPNVVISAFDDDDTDSGSGGGGGGGYDNRMSRTQTRSFVPSNQHSTLLSNPSHPPPQEPASQNSLLQSVRALRVNVNLPSATAAATAAAAVPKHFASLPPPTALSGANPFPLLSAAAASTLTLGTNKYGQSFNTTGGQMLAGLSLRERMFGGGSDSTSPPAVTTSDDASYDHRTHARGNGSGDDNSPHDSAVRTPTDNDNDNDGDDDDRPPPAAMIPPPRSVPIYSVGGLGSTMVGTGFLYHTSNTLLHHSSAPVHSPTLSAASSSSDGSSGSDELIAAGSSVDPYSPPLSGVLQPQPSAGTGTGIVASQTVQTMQQPRQQQQQHQPQQSQSQQPTVGGPVLRQPPTLQHSQSQPQAPMQPMQPTLRDAARFFPSTGIPPQQQFQQQQQQQQLHSQQHLQPPAGYRQQFGPPQHVIRQSQQQQHLQQMQQMQPHRTAPPIASSSTLTSPLITPPASPNRTRSAHSSPAHRLQPPVRSTSAFQALRATAQHWQPLFGATPASGSSTPTTPTGSGSGSVPQSPSRLKTSAQPFVPRLSALPPTPLAPGQQLMQSRDAGVSDQQQMYFHHHQPHPHSQQQHQQHQQHSHQPHYSHAQHPHSHSHSHSQYQPSSYGGASGSGSAYSSRPSSTNPSPFSTPTKAQRHPPSMMLHHNAPGHYQSHGGQHSGTGSEVSSLAGDSESTDATGGGGDDLSGIDDGMQQLHVGGGAGGSAAAAAAAAASLIDRESPNSKNRFKSFYREFRNKEKESEQRAYDFAVRSFDSLPHRIHWRVAMEVADLAKRQNKITQARKWYEFVNRLQPYASQGWLESGKMEEECGELVKCQRILETGLAFCPLNESLLAKIVRHLERLGNLSGARAQLASLRHMSIDKVWKTVLEGALLEARAGNLVIARQIFKYLMARVSWYGPVYYEASRLEEKYEDYTRALAIAERGLTQVPKYGPLWFIALRLYDRRSQQQQQQQQQQSQSQQSSPPLAPVSELTPLASASTANAIDSKADWPAPNTPTAAAIPATAATGTSAASASNTTTTTTTRMIVHKAMANISNELTWKVYFEWAQMAERANRFEESRHAFAYSIIHCPKNLRWKTWLAGARMELRSAGTATASGSAGGEHRIRISRMLLNRSLDEVPKKMRATVLLECSRLEEFCGHLGAARNILRRAQRETKFEWKVFLESVLLEMRAGKWRAAVRAAEAALLVHSGTGRLWAVLLQLMQRDSSSPDAHELQMKVFKDAIREVPKSGEVWCEGARMCMNPTGKCFNLKSAKRFLNFAIQFTPQYGDSFIEYLRLKLLVSGSSETVSGGGGSNTARPPTSQAPAPAPAAAAAAADDVVARVHQLCLNAEPNYGGLWFAMKRTPDASAMTVLEDAKHVISDELQRNKSVYQRAILANWQRAASGGEKENAAPPATAATDAARGEFAVALDFDCFATPAAAAAEETKSVRPPPPTSRVLFAETKSQPKASAAVPAPPKAVASTATAAAAVAIAPKPVSTIEVVRSEEERVQWQNTNINHLQRLYPLLKSLSQAERYEVLFASDPITP